MSAGNYLFNVASPNFDVVEIVLLVAMTAFSVGWMILVARRFRRQENEQRRARADAFREGAER